MKGLLSGLMMVLCLLTGFQQVLIVVHFKLNQKAITQELCVNQNNPELHCNGICYLKKQLQKAEETAETSFVLYQKVEMFTVPSVDFQVRNLVVDVRSSTSIYKEIDYIDPYSEIFVPPPIT